MPLPTWSRKFPGSPDVLLRLDLFFFSFFLPSLFPHPDLTRCSATYNPRLISDAFQRNWSHISASVVALSNASINGEISIRAADKKSRGINSNEVGILQLTKFDVFRKLNVLFTDFDESSLSTDVAESHEASLVDRRPYFSFAPFIGIANLIFISLQYRRLKTSRKLFLTPSRILSHVCRIIYPSFLFSESICLFANLLGLPK